MTMIKNLFLVLGLSLALINPISAADKPDDADALKGVKVGKVLFDVNISNAKKMSLYLSVVQETVTDFERQGVKPDVILAFRGHAVKIVSTNQENTELPELENVEKVAAQLADLSAKGVRMEACSVATRLFGVDNASMLPGIKVVGNTFVSLTGYQAQGYAIIPLY